MIRNFPITSIFNGEYIYTKDIVNIIGMDFYDVGYLAEGGGSGQDAAGSIDAITLSPKKLISVVSMSAEMMTQNASAEAAPRAQCFSMHSAFRKMLVLQTVVTLVLLARFRAVY